KVFAQIASLDRAFFAAIKELRRIQTVDEGACMDLLLDAPLPLDPDQIRRILAAPSEPPAPSVPGAVDPVLRR
ncbi:MAG TPA: hypothetical protein VMH28_32430, partial [Candidatus Acidoferrales bacterium]|nr:hypothetical protein [Candidatus Acidoferrales bacterium]